MLKTANLPIVAEGLGVLFPMPKRQDSWIYDLGFFPISKKTRFDPVLAFVAFHRGQEVDWSCGDLERPFFFSCWNMGEVIDLAGQHVHERKLEVDGQLVYHKRLLPAITALFMDEARLSSTEDAI